MIVGTVDMKVVGAVFGMVARWVVGTILTAAVVAVETQTMEEDQEMLLLWLLLLLVLLSREALLHLMWESQLQNYTTRIFHTDWDYWQLAQSPLDHYPDYSDHSTALLILGFPLYAP